jgi:aquaporin Z
MTNKCTRAFLAEVLGTFVLVFIGCGTALFAGSHVGHLGISLAFGCSLMVLAYAIGPISGCHINPAVSLGMLLTGNIRLPAFGGYVLAQIIGALTAGFTLVQIANGSPMFDPAQGFGEYSPGGYSFIACTIIEIALTALLMVTVLATTKKSFAPGFGGLAVGIALVIIHLLAIPITNASVNPARSLGVAFFAGGWAMEQLWFFFAMPALGAILGVILHKIIWCSEE